MKRILITEDDRFMANVCRQKFEEAGYSVVVAHDGHAAIEELVRNPPQVVMLDLMLPEIDGLGVLRFIRSREGLRALPVIIVSNSSYFSGVVQAAMHAGATHFLNKGECTPQTLLDELRKLETPEQALPPPLPPAAVAQVHETPHQAAEQARAARVLVVDDDRVIHGVLAFFLAEAGFVVQSAFNGRQALEMAEADAPDLMVLDGMMPELDGLEVLKRWQQLPHLCKIPVMMLTAENDAEKKADAIRSGAVDYLTKPFSPDDLVTRAMQLLGK